MVADLNSKQEADFCQFKAGWSARGVPRPLRTVQKEPVSKKKKVLAEMWREPLYTASESVNRYSHHATVWQPLKNLEKCPMVQQSHFLPKENWNQGLTKSIHPCNSSTWEPEAGGSVQGHLSYIVKLKGQSDIDGPVLKKKKKKISVICTLSFASCPTIIINHELSNLHSSSEAPDDSQRNKWRADRGCHGR